jgi:hypothetical protein
LGSALTAHAGPDDALIKAMTIKVASSPILIDAPDICLPPLSLNFRLRSCEITYTYIDASRI